MPEYSNLLINTIFETIFDFWPNREGEASALKAVTFFLKEHTKEELLEACEAYALENSSTDPSFTYKLSNFLNYDHYRDVLDANNLEKLRAKKNAAIEVITTWNEVCRPHWIKVMHIETRIPLAQKALNDKFFSANWKTALEKATKIFAYRFREGDPREKIKINFRWFCDTSFDKHNVLKISEGEFGGAFVERIIKPVEKKEIDYKARQALAEEMKILFPTIKFEDPKKPPPPPIVVSEEAKAIAEQIKSKAKPFIHYDKNSTNKIATQIGAEAADIIAEGVAKESSELDAYDFD